MAQYLKPDSELGYIEDSAQIEYLKFNNLRHVVLGCMLGDFDETGAYTVSPEIVKELIEMKKYVVDSYDNIEICKSALKLDKHISFMVTFEGNRATLSLLEKLNYEANNKIDSGTYSNINEYILDIVETSGEVNRNAIYSRWNISVYGGEVVDIFNCDNSILEKYFGIVNRFKYLLQANKVLLEEENNIEETEIEHTNQLFEILEHYPKLKKEVMQSVKQTLIEKKGAVSVKNLNFAKTFNEVLENAIEKNINILDEKEKQEFKVESRNAVVNLNIKRLDIIEVEKEDNHEQDSAPKITVVKIVGDYRLKSVVDTAQEFATSYKNATNEKKKQVNDVKSENKELFVKKLNKEELNELVDIPETKKEQHASLIAEIISEKEEVKKETNNSVQTKSAEKDKLKQQGQKKVSQTKTQTQKKREETKKTTNNSTQNKTAEEEKIKQDTTQVYSSYRWLVSSSDDEGKEVTTEKFQKKSEDKRRTINLMGAEQLNDVVGGEKPQERHVKTVENPEEKIKSEENIDGQEIITEKIDDNERRSVNLMDAEQLNNVMGGKNSQARRVETGETSDVSAEENAIAEDAKDIIEQLN